MTPREPIFLEIFPARPLCSQNRSTPVRTSPGGAAGQAPARRRRVRSLARCAAGACEGRAPRGPTEYFFLTHPLKKMVLIFKPALRQFRSATSFISTPAHSRTSSTHSLSCVCYLCVRILHVRTHQTLTDCRCTCHRRQGSVLNFLLLQYKDVSSMNTILLDSLNILFDFSYIHLGQQSR